MSDPSRVQVRESLCDFSNGGSSVLLSVFLLRAQFVEHLTASDQLHHQDQLFIRVEDLIQHDHVRMLHLFQHTAL